MYRPEIKNHARCFLIGPPKEKSGCCDAEAAALPPGTLLALSDAGPMRYTSEPWYWSLPTGLARLITIPIAAGEEASFAPVLIWMSPSDSLAMLMLLEGQFCSKLPMSMPSRRVA